MKFIVTVTGTVPYEVEADSPEAAGRIVAEFVDAPGVVLGDAPVDGQNPWPLDSLLYEFEVAADDEDSAAALRQAHEARMGPIQ